jgi:hypothetical protein
MGKTWDQCNEILGQSGFLSDPAVLEAQVHGASAEITPEQAIAGLGKIVVSLVACREVLGQEIDDLRSRIEADAA